MLMAIVTGALPLVMIYRTLKRIIQAQVGGGRVQPGLVQKYRHSLLDQSRQHRPGIPQIQTRMSLILFLTF